jgi:ethanolamine ammonia-lyase large subunit
MESINNLRIIETRANSNFIMGLKMIDEIISKKK